jgi:hypothetical protein
VVSREIGESRERLKGYREGAEYASQLSFSHTFSPLRMLYIMGGARASDRDKVSVPSGSFGSGRMGV